MLPPLTIQIAEYDRHKIDIIAVFPPPHKKHFDFILGILTCIQFDTYVNSSNE